MKKEHFEEPAQAVAEHNNQAAVSLPLSLANAYNSRSSIGDLGLPLIKALASQFSNSIHEYIKDKTLENWNEACDYLWSNDCIQESDFWNGVMMMSAFIEGDGVDYLISRGVSILPEESQSEFLARVFLNQRQEFEGFLNELVSIQGGEIDGKTFHVFQLPISPLVAANFSLISTDVLKERLRPHYQELGFGTYCEITRVGQEPHFGFMIDHGLKVIEKTKITPDQKKLTIDASRDPKTAMVIFIPESNALWICCHTKTDPQVYADVILSLLQDDFDLPEKKLCSLNHLLDMQLKDKLATAARELGLGGIALKGLDIDFADGGNTRLPTRISCQTEVFQRFAYAIDPANKVKTLKLRLVPVGDGKPMMIELKPGTVKLGKRLDPMVATNLLTYLGVWAPYVNA